MITAATPGSGPMAGLPGPVRVWGVPLVPWTLPQAVDAIDHLIEARRPSFFITANLHYAMLHHERTGLAGLADRAAFVLADGAPLVWAARRQGTPLPERVAGSDLIYNLAERAAEKGHRLFFLGGPPGIAEQAARALEARYPGLVVAGTLCPPFRDLDETEHAALIGQIRAARPDLLMVAFGQPKGEIWIDQHLEELGVPVCVQVGATLDFVAGRVIRAPRWMQRTGLEWFFRMAQEPTRLAPRYARNARFLLGMTLRGPRRRGGAPEEARR
jgi:N-acetylglucosaminyldiphosphoundecaprenol N-acetyl-beta-D-mannosaminyltransferase